MSGGIIEYFFTSCELGSILKSMYPGTVEDGHGRKAIFPGQHMSKPGDEKKVIGSPYINGSVHTSKPKKSTD